MPANTPNLFTPSYSSSSSFSSSSSSSSTLFHRSPQLAPSASIIIDTIPAPYQSDPHQCPHFKLLIISSQSPPHTSKHQKVRSKLWFRDWLTNEMLLQLLLILLLLLLSQDRAMPHISCHCWSQKEKTTLCLAKGPDLIWALCALGSSEDPSLSNSILWRNFELNAMRVRWPRWPQPGQGPRRDPHQHPFPSQTCFPEPDLGLQGW